MWCTIGTILPPTQYPRLPYTKTDYFFLGGMIFVFVSFLHVVYMLCMCGVDVVYIYYVYVVYIFCVLHVCTCGVHVVYMWLSMYNFHSVDMYTIPPNIPGKIGLI